MIQHFQEEIFQRMSPEARARKLSIMRALAKTMRARNKENENPLNNNTGVPLALGFKQSTPLKVPQITDLDEIQSDSDSEFPIEESVLKSSYILDRNSSNEEYMKDDNLENPQLVITKLLNPVTDLESVDFETVSESTENDREDLDDTLTHEYDVKHWKSLEVLHENAEHEFCKSLEESKLYLSNASLLEEIEADLPSPYSLTRPFNYTFHTISSYRTQTRLARMVRFGLHSKTEKDMNSTCEEFLQPSDGVRKNPSSRIHYLEKEASVQKALADQAEKALNLSKSQKFLGIQHLESEKALLLANLRHQAAIREISRVKRSGEISNEKLFGELTISEVCFQVEASAESSKEQYLCIAMEKENVLSSSVMSNKLDGKLHFNEEFKFDKLEKDFVVFLEMYKLNSQEPKKTILKTALAKKFKRTTPVNTNRSITYSLYGKSSFVRVMSSELRLDHISTRENDKCVLLSRLPEYLTQCSVTARVKTDIKANFELCGFLNVFRQTWHRRWFILSGYYLKSWLYPEDYDSGKSPVECVYLPNCTSATPVGMEVCIRPNCFAINLRSPEEKILFSADSNTNMDQWVNNLNLLIENILAWKPNI